MSKCEKAWKRGMNKYISNNEIYSFSETKRGKDE